MKYWSTKEIQYIKRNALLAETNEILNVTEMAKKLGRSENAVVKRVCHLRKEGQLPAVKRENAFDSKGRPWTSSEEKRLISMHKQGTAYDEIATALGRSVTACYSKGTKLLKKGKIKKARRSAWTDTETELLLDQIEFDEHGYVNNYPHLAHVLNKQQLQISNKISNLRREEKINVKADKTKSSVASKKAMNRFNDARFAHVPKREGKPMESAKTENAVKKSSSKVSIESKKVSLILTTIEVDGHVFEKYFTEEGELIAKKELTTPASI